MKNLTLPFIVFIFTSCTVPHFYQVYKTKTDTGILKNNQIVFEDKSCKIMYDLWEDGGDIGFNIYNKTDEDITIDLTKTFFVLNGITYEYFKDRTYSKSSSYVTSNSYNYRYFGVIQNASKESSSSSGATFYEKPERTIPANTEIKISEYRVTNSRYVNCDLPKYPARSRIKTLNFDKLNSPFVFYNLITYSSKGSISRLENRFHVTEITNYPSKLMIERIYKSECGTRLSTPIKKLKDSAPDKFYYEYLMQ